MLDNKVTHSTSTLLCCTVLHSELNRIVGLREKTHSVLPSLPNVSDLDTTEQWLYTLRQFLITPFQNYDPLIFVLIIPFPGQLPFDVFLDSESQPSYHPVNIAPHMGYLFQY